METKTIKNRRRIVRISFDWSMYIFLLVLFSCEANVKKHTIIINDKSITEPFTIENIGVNDSIHFEPYTGFYIRNSNDKIIYLGFNDTFESFPLDRKYLNRKLDYFAYVTRRDEFSSEVVLANLGCKDFRNKVIENESSASNEKIVTCDGFVIQYNITADTSKYFIKIILP